jgi:hypothetical protein
MPPVPASLALDLAFLSFHLVEPDGAFFIRWSSPTQETRYPRPSLTVGVLELLAPCNYMPVLLISKRGVLRITSGRFCSTSSSLLLAEMSTACLVVKTGLLNSAPELLAPCSSISYRNLLEGESLFSFRS